MAEQDAKANVGEHGAGRELTITRVFDAPRKVVFAAWTDAKQVAQWWGPTGFTNPVCELDVRPGGAILIHMRAPDGTVYPMSGVYKEVVEPERIVFTSAALDKDGKAMFENLNTIIFSEQDGKTTVVVSVKVLKSSAAAEQHLAGMEMGWKLTLDRLEVFVVKG
jgi:uncharacterized protein YndB with AHSA1/START domain